MSTGAGVAIPFLVVGKLMGAKLIFLEVFAGSMHLRSLAGSSRRFVIVFSSSAQIKRSFTQRLRYGASAVIFVTVGTHEQPMNRQSQDIARLRSSGVISDRLKLGVGVSRILDPRSESDAFLFFEEMERAFREARMVICHGGPATILQARMAGKTPIVVPRRRRFGEHDYQVDFSRRLAEMNLILLVEDIAGREEVIGNYDRLAAERQAMAAPDSAGPRELCRRLTEYCQGFRLLS